MKHISKQLPVLFVFLLTACLEESMNDIEPSEYGAVIFNLIHENSETRAYTSNSGNESVIGTVQFLLFDSSGTLANRNSFSGTGTSYEFSLPFGSYTACVFVNVPEIPSSSKSLTSLDALSLDYFSSNIFTERLHPMYGRVSFTVSSAELSKAVTVRRYDTRYNVKSIENRLADASLKLEHVYLTNIQGGFYYTSEKNTSAWYSKYGRPDVSPTKESRITSATNLKTKEYSYRSLGATSLTKGSTYTPSSKILFYAFPNHSTQDGNGWASTFTERQTRIVLATEIAGNKYYYPVNLINMQGNTSYDVSFIITKLGSPDPDTFDWAIDEDKDVTIDLGDMENGDDIIIEF